MVECRKCGAEYDPIRKKCPNCEIFLGQSEIDSEELSTNAPVHTNIDVGDKTTSFNNVGNTNTAIEKVIIHSGEDKSAYTNCQSCGNPLQQDKKYQCPECKRSSLCRECYNCEKKMCQKCLEEKDPSAIPNPDSAGTYSISLTVTGYGGSNTKTHDTYITAFDQSALPTQGLVAYYPLNGSANDESGNGNDGKVHGNITYTDGKIGDAASFSGNEQFVDCGNDNSLSLIQFTIAAWFKWDSPHSTDSYRTIISKGAKDALGRNDNWMIFVTSNEPHSIGSRVGHGTPDIPPVNLMSGFAASDRNWHHVALIYDSIAGTGCLYVDGVCAIPRSELNNAHTNSGSVIIGAWIITDEKAYGSWDGLIDEVRIYDRTLSEMEIQALYSAGSYN